MKKSQTYKEFYFKVENQKKIVYIGTAVEIARKKFSKFNFDKSFQLRYL